MEYFNKSFLLHKIGQKIGRVIKVDSTTENVERGQYTRMCVEVDLTKPLLSKFRLNGRVWGIQYEGLKMICFKCGKQGHKEDICGSDNSAPQEECQNVQSSRPTERPPNIQEHTYGSWMLVKKTTRRSHGRSQGPGVRSRGRDQGEPNQDRTDSALNRNPQSLESLQLMATRQQQNNSNRTQNHGSRFRALADCDLNDSMESLDQERDIEKESEPTEPINKAMTTQCHTETEEREEAQNGCNNLPRQDLVPYGRNQEPTVVSPPVEARVLYRSAFRMGISSSAQNTTRGPESSQINRDLMTPGHTVPDHHSGLVRGQPRAQANSVELDNPPGRDNQALVGSELGTTLVNRHRQVRLRMGEDLGQHANAHGDMEMDN